jgi:hypothetical protein
LAFELLKRFGGAQPPLPTGTDLPQLPKNDEVKQIPHQKLLSHEQ